jgi:hypothetical protein
VITFFVALVWLGGLGPAFEAAKKNGHGWCSIFDAIFWPADVGWHLAKNACAEEKSFVDGEDHRVKGEGAIRPRAASPTTPPPPKP